MRKIVLLVLLVSMGFISYSCKRQDDSTVSTKDQKGASSAITILQKSFEEKKSDIVVSGLSVDFAIGMLINGTTGKSLKELEDFFKTSKEDKTKELQDKLQNMTTKLKIANAIWGNGFKDTYKATIKEKFKAYVQTLPNNTKVINNWVAEATDNEIDKVLEEKEPSSLAFYLVNTILFKDEWKSNFPEKNTEKEAKFKSLQGSDTKVDMMHQTSEFEYAEADGIQAVKLPYKEKGWMVVYLPKEGTDFTKFVQGLSTDKLDMKYTNKRVKLSLPKFDIKSDINIKSIFQNLGIKEMFDKNNEDLNELVEGGGYIVDIMQKAFIKVDEKGTKAGAATVIEGAIKSAVEPDPIEFKVDRPFLFYVSEGEFLGVYTGNAK